MSSTEPKAPRRATRQRAAVEQVLAGGAEFRSAQQIHTELRATGSDVGLTTVYRALQSMAAAGEVDVLRTEDGEQVFRHCSSEHHHHLVCRRCGRAVEISGPPMQKWVEKVAAEHTFTDIDHTLELFGLCADCAA